MAEAGAKPGPPLSRHRLRPSPASLRQWKGLAQDKEGPPNRSYPSGYRRRAVEPARSPALARTKSYARSRELLWIDTQFLLVSDRCFDGCIAAAVHAR